MGYYLDRAPFNKTQFTELNFTPQQANFIASMMVQCKKLRQRDVIINLFRHSLPDKFTLELVKKESQDGERSWFDPMVLEQSNQEFHEESFQRPQGFNEDNTEVEI
ncbi:MAG TPA: hypothetical protein VKN14_05460 [Flavobacteriaceae bacterium]|nr:hypothetical protein [Flavobacteriaceae bacterium]